MIIRNLEDARNTSRLVLSDNWESCRLILDADNMGFSFHITTMYAGTKTRMHYKNHLESVYCISGEGSILDLAEQTEHKLSKGVIYALDKNDPHEVHAVSDLEIACVFNPALTGKETHAEDGSYPLSVNKISDSVSAEKEVAELIEVGDLERRVPSELNIAYLNLKDHPRGQMMLNALNANGFTPSIVIEEASERAKLGQSDQLKYLKRAASFDRSFRYETAHACKRMEIPYQQVLDHNSSETLEAIRSVKPDLVVLGDTGILEDQFLQECPCRVLNIHPGYLPHVRGNNPYIWSIIHGLQQGASAHFVTHEIDKGPILYRSALNTANYKNLGDLYLGINRKCCDVLISALHTLVSGTCSPIPQVDDARLTFKGASDLIKKQAEEILRDISMKPERDAFDRAARQAMSLGLIRF